ncbi:MAG TPA: serine hydrolase domain-containing protein [Vicinamibacteria bacterium]|nr:serine hydrolase domain-containing protein [Vicinamibacteria bacterium]
MRPTPAALLLTATLGAADTPTRPFDAGGDPAYRPVEAAPQPLPGGGLKSPEELEAFVDGFVGAEREAYDVAGMIVAVVKDGQVYFAKGYGWADVERGVPASADGTLFRPGSVSKLFTWTAVMQLVEQGKLDLDADVNAYLTQFKIPASDGGPITLRHALTHTVGLEDGGIGYLMARTPQEIVPLARSLSAHVPTRVRPVGSSREGLSSSYSNWATALAGLVVANVSGVSFEDYVQANILGPLGMESSTFREPLPEPLEKRMSRGYSFEAGAFKPQGYEYIANFGPAGALAATATDMARFMIAHLQQGAVGDGRILKPETVRAMHARVFSPHPAVNGSGLGFYETYMNGRRVIGHGGDTNYFHSELGLLDEEGIGFFVSVNTGGKAALVPRHFARAFMDHYFPARLPAVKPPADFGTRAARYAGHYRALRHSYTRFEKVFALLGGTTVVPTADNKLVIPGLLGDVAQYVEVAPSVFREVDGDRTIAFVENGAGQVAGMVGQFAFIPFYRLAWYDGSPFHYTLLGLSLLLFVIAVVSALRHWRSDKAGPKTARWARRTLGALAALNLVFVVAFASIFAADLDDLIFALPTGLYAILTLPLIGLLLTALAVVLAARVWREGLWSRGARLVHTAGVVAAIAFVWFLNYWNLLGYRIG